MKIKSCKAYLALFQIDGKQSSVVALAESDLGHASIPVHITVGEDDHFMVRAGHQTEVFNTLPSAVAWASRAGVLQTPGAITVLEQRNTLAGTPMFEPFDLYRVATPIKDDENDDLF
ncbi:hypothetical protein D477_014261 [Arthrobacter crystallopoietes BAB-32]|uniref:Uncharacterized protein n=2 Tax=Crystallibacter crystallopoietes TaxID=37928 RepID=N1V0G1_9MICC|nr:hypothetical protein D477_014261 [Arthrobacter crystallopoietes BAB-32]